jgi:phosphohistidine phosphatase
MNLYLMRHGIAADKNQPSETDDARRPLSPKSLKRTRRIAKGIRRLSIAFDVILSSPLARARQTADIVGAELDNETRVEEIPSLAPDGGFDQLMAGLARYQNHQHLLLVGHKPLLGEVLSSLLAGVPAPRINFEFKKGALCRVEVASLAPLEPGRLTWFLTPKQLRMLGDQLVNH